MNPNKLSNIRTFMSKQLKIMLLIMFYRGSSLFIYQKQGISTLINHPHNGILRDICGPALRGLRDVSHLSEVRGKKKVVSNFIPQNWTV